MKFAFAPPDIVHHVAQLRSPKAAPWLPGSSCTAVIGFYNDPNNVPRRTITATTLAFGVGDRPPPGPKVRSTPGRRCAPRKKCEFRTSPIRKILQGISAPRGAETPLEPRARAGEDDIAGDDEPEGVIADGRDVDEDADDRKTHQHERDDKSEAHLQPPGSHPPGQCISRHPADAPGRVALTATL
jgi:hypothetical protein